MGDDQLDKVQEKTAAAAITHLVIMGVSGSGKTTLATILTDRLGWPYAEADEFHPQVNIDKMTSGEALTDQDRAPWLEAIRDWLSGQAREGRSAIVTCSALKGEYREVLRAAQGRVVFVHLHADEDVIASRLSGRTGHFMPPSLLPSQFATLKPLGDDEDGLTVVVDVPPDAVADTVTEFLQLERA
ncbi:gluconokinase [Cellulomonas bogoriensis]|uniref:Gluconokinase n=1 Tax=Cellulomonas bogoriensis 69B4 = DSM 16987 TaxID=1386082 RepID=A0A0A0BL15_9CELL|nr:gluconokinase [Cellulomonas bogoriensis]KGM08666.1 gluconate kinase [Cellulomonas bogoriensis 69B4 = DSM 16987]